MMQVPVPQHLGSSLIGAPYIHNAGLAIGSSVICNLAIIEFHGWISQGAVFGHPARNSFSPHTERLGL